MTEKKPEEKKVTGEGVNFDTHWYPAGATEPVLRPEVKKAKAKTKKAEK